MLRYQGYFLLKGFVTGRASYCFVYKGFLIEINKEGVKTLVVPYDSDLDKLPQVNMERNLLSGYDHLVPGFIDFLKRSIAKLDPFVFSDKE